MTGNLRVVLKRQPEGVPVPEDFALEVAEAGDQGVLCRTRCVSLDPYIRGRLSGRHLTGVISPGEPMSSELILEVAESAHGFTAGEVVRAHGPWQHHVRLDAQSLQPVPNDIAPASLFLGVLGMPGLTAYAGIKTILRPKSDETLVVSAAAGPVGATVAQLGRIAGSRVVGIAGSVDKCRWLVDVAELDEVINYRRENVREALDRTCPKGIDMYFDNVGGDVLAAVMERLAHGARVALCGLMSQYNSDSPLAGPNPGLIIRARACVQGLVVYDHEALRNEMQTALVEEIQAGRLAVREDVSRGLESAPDAFCRLMRGENFGKALVDLES
ncbi:MAG: NADP-dependent oxidoreductase [Gammaproteobacteria bacterium]|nr:NADP-dependent oxidoreductase [Gammaproteobacteria bacterium]